MVYVKEIVLGIDIGTSSVKAIAINKKGDVLDVTSEPIHVINQQTGFSEQNPEDWFEASKDCIKYLLNSEKLADKKVKGISFSGQMHSLVLLDDANQVIRPAILWNDVRTTKECQEIMATFGDQLLAITKNVALEGFTLPKIRWVQKNEPANWEKVAHVMLPKDYLAFWLTGRYSMDYSDAAGTLLLDVEEKVWSAAILKQFDIDEAVLPTLH